MKEIDLHRKTKLLFFTKNKRWSNVHCWSPNTIFLHVSSFFSSLFLTNHVVMYIIISFYSIWLKSSWHSLSLSHLKFLSVLLLIINVLPIEGKHLLPSVGELYSHCCIYYRIIADGRFCEKRWQHGYDIGGLYLQSIYVPFISYNSS